MQVSVFSLWTLFYTSKAAQSYKHGTFCCGDHASHATAVQSAHLSRNRAMQELIEAAARELLKWKIADPQWQGDSDIKGHLAAKLCQVIAARRLEGYRQDVRTHWITRHESAIEQKRVELSSR